MIPFPCKPGCLAIIVAAWAGSLFGQITRTLPLDVLGLLQGGGVTVTSQPPFSVGSAEKIFDGNPYTNAGTLESDSLTITLEFDSPVRIHRSDVFFWQEGTWNLEAAASREDLDNRSGSYQHLVDNRNHSQWAWDSTAFSPMEATLIRLTGFNPRDSTVYLGEWTLYTTITLTALAILPEPLRIIPGTSLQLKVEIVDDMGTRHPFDLDETVSWSSANPSVATVDEMGRLHGVSLGTAEITASTPSLSGTATAAVVEDFQSTRAQPMTVKVALVLQDPVIDSTGMRRIHEVRSWTDPEILVSILLEEFRHASDGVVRFDVVQTYDDDAIFSRLDGELMTVDTLAYFYSTVARMNQLKSLTEEEGRVRFDYHEMIDRYDLDTQRNNGTIDEVWVYAHPFAGMYESILAGPGAFWWNAPPLDHPGLQKLLSIMGWNYERGVAEALHSFGHRAESALWHVYGRWDVFADPPNAWELFTRIDKDLPGKAHVGNIHFPPNGESDYDYENDREVVTYADNWKRYPVLLDQTRTVNCLEWDCSHLGYMRWWLEHLPRFKGVTDGVLNNWWHYIVDYEGAVDAASLSIGSNPETEESPLAPTVFSLGQNYPNPFNSVTTIPFTLGTTAEVTVSVYDILGRKVADLLRATPEPGGHRVLWNARGIPSGIYICRLQVRRDTLPPMTRRMKMVVLK
ncbi:MAG: Ig-like domain-containing protein [Fidelibacterota bacterium]